MNTQQNYKSNSLNPINNINNSPVNLLSTTYDPTKTPQKNTQQHTTQQHTTQQHTTQQQNNRNNTPNTNTTYLNHPIQ
jgi:hypothetical protein